MIAWSPKQNQRNLAVTIKVKLQKRNSNIAKLGNNNLDMPKGKKLALLKLLLLLAIALETLNSLLSILRDPLVSSSQPSNYRVRTLPAL
jgi:hypothetical protein